MDNVSIDFKGILEKNEIEKTVFEIKKLLASEKLRCEADFIYKQLKNNVSSCNVNPIEIAKKYNMPYDSILCTIIALALIDNKE